MDSEPMMYHLRFHGGPEDGKQVMSPRPYSRIEHSDGTTYAAAMTGGCEVWVSDTERAIDLQYVGKTTPRRISAAVLRAAADTRASAGKGEGHGTS